MQPHPRQPVVRTHARIRVRAAAGLLAAMLGGGRGAAAQDVTSATSPASSASPASPRTRLGDLYREVGRDHPRVTAARALARAALARVPGASRPPDPQLQLGFMNYALPGLAPMRPLGMTQLQLMQMLPVGGKLGLAGRVASARAAATGERVQEVAWDLRGETATAFYDLYAADRRLEIERETLRLLRDIARTAESMYRVGAGRQADVLRAQVEIARMAEDTLRRQATRRAMVARLNALLSRDPAAPIAPPALPCFPDSLPAPAWLDSVAAAGRPTIRAGLEEARAADASASLARKEIIPDLQLGVQYGQRGAAERTTERSTERMGSLMIGASIPVFARDRQLRMREEAGAMRAMAHAEVAAMRAETRGRIGEAYAELTRARDLARLYRTTILPQAEAAVASAMSSYRAGTVDFLTLLEGRRTVNGYREELAALEAEQGKAWAELERLTGRELVRPDAGSATDPHAAPDERGGAR